MSAAALPLRSGSGPSTLLDAAITMADAEGIASVTLRSVADRVGLSLAAVQRDLGSRDRLESMMVQRVLSRRSVTSDGDERPAETLTRLAEAEWAVYRAHPWLVEAMATTRPPLVPAVLDASRAMIEAFCELGLDHEEALDRFLALSSYVQGTSLLLSAEQRESVGSGPSYPAWWTEEARRLERTGATLRHPWLAGLLDRGPGAAFDADAVFRAGLPLVIRGLTDLA